MMRQEHLHEMFEENGSDTAAAILCLASVMLHVAEQMKNLADNVENLENTLGGKLDMIANHLPGDGE